MLLFGCFGPQRFRDHKRLTTCFELTGLSPELISIFFDLSEVNLPNPHRPEAPVAGRVPEVGVLVGCGNEDTPSRSVNTAASIGGSCAVYCLRGKQLYLSHIGFVQTIKLSDFVYPYALNGLLLFALVATWAKENLFPVNEFQPLVLG